MDYHGIVINLSIKDKSLLKSLNKIGQKKVILNWLVLLKISVQPEELDVMIKKLQSSLVERFLFYETHFYFHFYRSEELIVVFKKKIFRTTTDPTTWGEVMAYGRTLGIPEKQLDFSPCHFNDETF